MGSADPAGKMDEKLKSENMQREQFSEWGVEAGVENGAMLTTHYSDILQNAPFRCQISKNFFAAVGKGALIPLTKILWTPLTRAISYWHVCFSF